MVGANSNNPLELIDHASAFKEHNNELQYQLYHHLQYHHQSINLRIL